MKVRRIGAILAAAAVVSLPVGALAAPGHAHTRLNAGPAECASVDRKTNRIYIGHNGYPGQSYVVVINGRTNRVITKTNVGAIDQRDRLRHPSGQLAAGIGLLRPGRPAVRCQLHGSLGFHREREIEQGRRDGLGWRQALRGDDRVQSLRLRHQPAQQHRVGDHLDAPLGG